MQDGTIMDKYRDACNQFVIDACEKHLKELDYLKNRADKALQNIDMDRIRSIAEMLEEE